MAADTFSPFIGMVLQTTGNNNVWGTILNGSALLPLERAIADTNRYLRAAGGSLTAGTYQANQNAAHTHTASGTTAAESNGHTHSYSGTTGNENQAHNHSGVVASLNVSNTSTGGGSFGAVGSVSTNTGTSGTENQNHNHSLSGATSDISAAHTHSFRSPRPHREARNWSLVAVCSIRY